MRSITNYNFCISILIVIALAISSCSSSSSSDPSDEPQNPPQRAIGVIPANGEPCSDYEFISNDLSKVSVLFRWNAAQFAESYELILFEGTTTVNSTTTSALETNVVLNRAKTYSWSVTSINSTGETSGDTYSFTTPGVPNQNFAPYTADISITFNTGTSEMTVSWVGSDEDGDELTYDVTVYEEGFELVTFNNLIVNSLDPIIAIPGTEYMVKVISTDTAGNFSESLKQEVYTD